MHQGDYDEKPVFTAVKRAGSAGRGQRLVVDGGAQPGFYAILVGAYGPSVGNLTIEKRDANTGDIIPVLGVGFAVTRASDGTLLLNVYDNDPNDKDSRPGYILLNNVPIGDYHVLEIQAPPGYLINPVLLDATPGGPPAVSRDEPVTHTAPSLSETGILIMIGGFAAAMVFLISRKSRRPLTPAA
jgi:hypothetical protein